MQFFVACYKPFHITQRGKVRWPVWSTLHILPLNKCFVNHRAAERIIPQGRRR